MVHARFRARHESLIPTRGLETPTYHEFTNPTECRLCVTTVGFSDGAVVLNPAGNPKEPVCAGQLTTQHSDPALERQNPICPHRIVCRNFQRADQGLPACERHPG